MLLIYSFNLTNLNDKNSNFSVVYYDKKEKTYLRI